jgi:hypothetical protein
MQKLHAKTLKQKKRALRSTKISKLCFLHTLQSNGADGGT